MQNKVIGIVIAIAIVGVGVAGIASVLVAPATGGQKDRQVSAGASTTPPPAANRTVAEPEVSMAPTKMNQQPVRPAGPEGPPVPSEPGGNMTMMSNRPMTAKADSSDERFDGKRIRRTDSEWRTLLTPDQFHILRESGTEQPYTGELTDNKKKGIYACAACGLHLFHSRAKFDSGTGWPSFFDVIFKQNVEEIEDRSLGEVRTEVRCRRCGGHLGHVFDDGPEPTGLRYCINSAALTFKPSR